jgi:hypothetical protein
MLVAVAGVLLVVLRSRNEKGTLSVNPRHIQFASVCLIVPTILILGLEKVLTSETTATLIGGLAGYLLSNLGKYEPSKDDPTKGGSTMQPPNSPLSDDPVDVEIEVTEPEEEKKTFKARMKRLGELPRPKNPLEKPEN